MTRIKICGINDAASLDAAIEGGADWIGLVFFPASPRYLTPEAAVALSQRAGGRVGRVGLFVDPALADIEPVLRQVPLDILQVYAPSSTVSEIKARFGRPVWRAVGVGKASDLPVSAADEDAFVIEAKPPTSATRPGGNGQAFDWSLLKGWKAPRPWVLAGGLNAQNVAEAIRGTRAPAVDVSSGVERERGVKSPAMIRAFIEAAKSTQG